LIEDLQIKISNGLRKVDVFTSNLKVEYIHYNFNENEIDPFYNINSEGLIVRPDRFIIGSIKSNKISKIKNYSI